MSFSLNSGMCVDISFGSHASSAFSLLVLLKGKDRRQLVYLPINDFPTTILKSKRKLNYQASYTQCDYSQWQCQWDRKISSNKLWILLLQFSPYAAIFWSITLTPPMLALYILIIFGHDTVVFVAEPLVRLITFDVPSIVKPFAGNDIFLRTENSNLLFPFSCHL